MTGRHQELVETQIDVSELAIGMHVIRLDRPWEQTDFLLQGFVIRSQSEIDALRALCDHVVIEGRLQKPEPVAIDRSSQDNRTILSRLFRSKASRQPRKQATVPTRKRVSYIQKVSLGEELSTAKSQLEEAQAIAQSIMGGLRVGRTLDLNNARKVVKNCVESVLRNESALMLLTKIKNQDNYTAEHCINVSILAAAFGKHLGLLEGEIESLALCGLLHDVGKTRIPDEILNKPGALTPEEFEVMKNHTSHGRSILMGTSHSLNMAVDVAFSHHERVDGKGYPRSLNASQIPYFAKIIGIVDAYDAITSTRIYDKGRASMQALDIINRNAGSQFDEELASDFIQLIGIYPPGSIVEMTNGEVGIVIESERSSKLKPKLLMVRESDKSPMPTFRTITLKTEPVDMAGNVYRIAREIPDGSHGVVLEDFVHEGIIVSKFSDESDEDQVTS